MSPCDVRRAVRRPWTASGGRRAAMNLRSTAPYIRPEDAARHPRARRGSGCAMALADDDPYVEELLGNASGRAAAPLPRRELCAELACGALLLAAVAALALLAPSERALQPIAAVGLIAVFAVAQQVQFEVGIGYTVPTQLVLMPMLILAPPALVPLLVAAGLLAGRLPSYVRGEVHVSRVAFVLPDAFYAVGPAMVMALLGPAHVGLEDWPVLAVALGAQAVCDAGFTGLRIWLPPAPPPPPPVGPSPPRPP